MLPQLNSQSAIFYSFQVRVYARFTCIARLVSTHSSVITVKFTVPKNAGLATSNACVVIV